MTWQTSRRKIFLDRTLVMAILNITPDSFSDGGRFMSTYDAIRRAEACIDEGADILDIGGESTRPGSLRVDAEDEIARVIPVIEAIAKRFDIPISIDTTKSGVARRAIDAGAEIVNDISGLRFDPMIANLAAESSCGLVLMHSRGTFETLHTEPPVEDVLAEVRTGLHNSVDKALAARVSEQQIVLDIGIGFGKTLPQNLELLANIDKIRDAFPQLPLLVGVSRKSFIGKLLGGASLDERLSGSLAATVIVAAGGAKIVRVHDVKETIEALKIADPVFKARVL
ncbi:MAG: dihydropteroate synthase [Acidobacteriota bacterium]